MSRSNPKLTLFTQFAAVAKSLAHAHRLEILEQLAQGERSVEVLAQRTGLSVANASQHLQQMRRAGIIAARREGKFIFYALADEAVLDCMAALRRIAYCRGPYCVLSYEAVAALRAHGFKARRLEDGLPEWRAAGLPVVVGNS